MESSKEITIYDIAKNLNVSASTVSRALKDDPNVNKQTKKKVFEKAAQMGYRSNQVAKNLRQQSTMTIGVLVSELNAGIMTPVLAGIESVASEAGYGIIITDSAQSAVKEMANAASLFQRRVDGVIATVAPDSNNADHFKVFAGKNIPVIFLDRAGRLAQSVSVIIDNVLCGYMATKHLADQGCRRIALVTAGLQDVILSQRYHGYLDALRESNIESDKDLLLIAASTEEAAEGAAKRILKLRPLPDGVFVTDDFAAAVLIRAFIEKGIRVPQDIAVVGFNNDVIGRLIRPALSTVNYPGREMGETAARILIDRLKGGGNIGSISTVMVRAEMIVRQSSMRRGKAG